MSSEKELIKDANQKIFLIVDNLKVHHSYIVKDWMKEHEDEIKAVFKQILAVTLCANISETPTP